jgi:hypothetical protein
MYGMGSSKVWRLKIGTEVIHIVEYADNLLLLAKEETVLQNMIDRLIEIG